MFTIQQIQQKLNDLGFHAGPVDGVIGRLTISAIRAFQAANAIPVTGLANTATLAVMFPDKTVAAIRPDRSPWLTLALAKRGMHEVNNKKPLMNFLAKGKGTIGDPAVIPWCGDFVETCVSISLPAEVLPANPYAAINWLPFGIECSPQPGAILVFWRGSPKGWQGHIGFYVSEDATHFHVLGGNQSNAVTITRIAKNRLRKGGCRWPKTAMPPNGARVVLGSNGLPVTENEA